MKKGQAGFTVLELLVAVTIVGILAAIAIPQYNRYRIAVYDAMARTDLRNAMTAIENAITSGKPLPSSAAQLAQYGHRLSKGVTFTRFALLYYNGQQSVHMHTKHARSPNSWHAIYPGSGATIEIR